MPKFFRNFASESIPMVFASCYDDVHLRWDGFRYDSRKK